MGPILVRFWNCSYMVRMLKLPFAIRSIISGWSSSGITF